MRNIDWTFCLIADAEAAEDRDLIQIVDNSVQNGASLIQLRVKTHSLQHFSSLANQLVSLLKPKHIPLIINDRIDIVLASKADGVHLGQSDLPYSQARALLGEQRIIGISVHTLSEALEGEKNGADYLGAGPVFSTRSKKDTGNPLGLEGLRHIREHIKVPILAIGGINPLNAADVMRCGVDGVAVISAVLGSKDIPAAVQELDRALRSI